MTLLKKIQMEKIACKNINQA